MKFSASQTALQSALEPLMGVVPTKSPMPVLTHFLATLSGNQLTLTATDLEITMSTVLAVSGMKDGKALLPGRKFLDMVREFGDGAIEVEATEGGRIELRAEKKRYDLSAESVQNYPKVPVLDEKSPYTVSEEKLSRALAKVAFAVSRDELRPQLTGIYLRLAPGELRLVSTDGHRLVRLNVVMETTKEDIKEGIVPAKAMNMMGRLCGRDKGGEARLFPSEKQIGFRVGATTLVSQLIEGRYPNYEAVIPTENKNVLVIEKEAFERAVRRAAIVANEISRQIRLKLHSDHVEIQVEDIEQGNEGRETVPCKYEGEAMEIGYNAGYILDILKHVVRQDGQQAGAAEVRFKLGTPTSAAIVEPIEQEKDENLLMLIMPVRLN